MVKKTLLIGLALATCSGVALAEDSATTAPAASAAAPSATAASAPAGGFFASTTQALASFEQTVTATWNSDKSELYVPLHTWHNRRMYSSDKIASYNENPFGIGYGKYRFDDNGNWHGVYAMEFMDSHHDIEPIAGYGFEKMWYPGSDWRLGVGYTVGVTMRADYGYVPIPLILPLLSIEKGRIAIQTTYMPGDGKNNGNVLFTWLRWQL